MQQHLVTEYIMHLLTKDLLNQYICETGTHKRTQRTKHHLFDDSTENVSKYFFLWWYIRTFNVNAMEFHLRDR